MCNAYEQQVTHADYRKAIEALELSATADESALETSGEVRIGDVGPVLRAAGNGVELVLMRFGWPPPRPKAGPVFNFKSDGAAIAGGLPARIFAQTQGAGADIVLDPMPAFAEVVIHRGLQPEHAFIEGARPRDVGDGIGGEGDFDDFHEKCGCEAVCGP